MDVCWLLEATVPKSIADTLFFRAGTTRYILNLMSCKPQGDALYPSVRMGLEMALLGALASSRSCSLLQLLCGVDGTLDMKSNVRVCGLLDSEGSAEDIADEAADLVEEGFCTVKLKVSPVQHSV